MSHVQSPTEGELGNTQASPTTQQASTGNTGNGGGGGDAPPAAGVVGAETEDPVQKAKDLTANFGNDKDLKVLNKFLWFLEGDGQANIAKDILEAKSKKKLPLLAEHLRTALLQPMQAKSSKKVAASPREGSNPFCRELSDKAKAPATKQHEGKANCLKRDNLGCAFLGIYDKQYWNGSTDQEKCTTVISHIIPYSFGNWKPLTNENQKRMAMRQWDALYRCFPHLQNTFFIGDVMLPRNLITMWGPLNDAFGSCQISLEKTDVPNRYTIRMSSGIDSPIYDRLRLLAEEPEEEIHVWFNDHFNDRKDKEEKNQSVDLPDRTLLEVHHTIAQILRNM